MALRPGALIADSQRAATRADIAVMNNGGIRADLRAGPVNYGSLFEILPFDNVLYRVTAPGAAVRAYLERLVEKGAPDMHASGVRVTYDLGRPAGQRITAAEVGGAPLRDDRTYTVAMNSFMATGDYGLYFRHESPEHLIAGLHTEEAIHDLVDPDNFGRSDEHDYMEKVAEKFQVRLPGLAEARLGNVWAGLYPISPDGLPIVGRYEGRDDVFTVAGAGGSGLQQSPALGRLAAEAIVHGETRTISAAQQALRPERASL